jgi:hypothetical protein
MRKISNGVAMGAIFTVCFRLAAYRQARTSPGITAVVRTG